MRRWKKMAEFPGWKKMAKKAAEYALDDYIYKGKTLRERIDILSSSENQNKWIPVSEGLPEEYTNVLCWYEYFRYGNYNKMYQTYGVGTYFGRFGWAGDITGEKARVIAWMPLPEPYKAESEDKE
jgi:hypothetical protein